MGRKRESKFSPKFINMLIQSYDIKGMDDIKSMIRDLVGDTLQGMLEGELTNELGYEKNNALNKETENSRNGYSHKTLRSEYGEVDINIPLKYYHKLMNGNAGHLRVYIQSCLWTEFITPSARMEL